LPVRVGEQARPVVEGHARQARAPSRRAPRRRAGVARRDRRACARSQARRPLRIGARDEGGARDPRTAGEARPVPAYPRHMRAAALALLLTSARALASEPSPDPEPPAPPPPPTPFDRGKFGLGFGA